MEIQQCQNTQAHSPHHWFNGYYHCRGRVAQDHKHNLKITTRWVHFLGFECVPAEGDHDWACNLKMKLPKYWLRNLTRGLTEWYWPRDAQTNARPGEMTYDRTTNTQASLPDR